MAQLVHELDPTGFISSSLTPVVLDGAADLKIEGNAKKKKP